MTDGKLSCAALNAATENSPDRVGLIADAKPDCFCETESFSAHSPGLVDGGETIVRVVCAPMHVHPRKLELKTSFFSHMATAGASVQRLEFASDAELSNCIEALIAPAVDRAWLGYVVAPAVHIRELMPRDGKQTFCVMDAGLEGNPAHAEIHSSFQIPEADQIEYRVALRDLFVRSGIKPRRTLRDGAVWGRLPNDLQGRSLPVAWQAIA